jgi:two-component system sensor histidine kinase PilS (NtrC family)
MAAQDNLPVRNPLTMKEKPAIRLRYLMLSRVAIVTLLLGIAIFMDIKGEGHLPEISLRALYRVIITSYILSLLYFCLPYLIKNIETNLYIQAIGDVLLVTGLVYATGGITSIYPVFYTLVIIYAVLFLARRGGLITASACSICYGLLLDLEYYKFLSPPYGAAFQDYPFATSYVFSRIITYIVSFYVVAFLAIFVVEQERKTRTLLREKETAFDQLDVLHRSIIESVDTGILTINLRGQIKSFNRAAEEITGFSFDEVENRNIADLFPAYGDFVTKIQSASNPEPERRRVEIQIDSGEKKPLTLGCSLSFLNDGNGKRIGDIIVFQDLTTVKKMEATLEKNRRLAFIGEIAAGLAHEMRNPLASIGGSIQVLNKSLLLGKADARLMQIILRGKDQLESFMRDFLLLSRPSPGLPECIRIADMIEEVLESIPYQPDWRDDIVMVKSFHDPLPVIRANKAEIRQLLWNLLINAVQSMKDGGRLCIEAEWSMDDVSGPGLAIRVADSGKGIPAQDAGRIFEPFFTTREKGTGMGLAIVNRIVDRHKGKIKVDSRAGEGTTFTVWLPCLTEAER